MLLTLLSLATVAIATPSIEERQTVSSSNCTTTGVHMIVARASTESPGIGSLLAPVVAVIQEYLPGSDYVGVDYPATLIEYGTSVEIGVANATKLIEEYVASCPDSKIVLLGYSQGAQVVGDTLCGISSDGFTATAALASKYSSNIVAVIQMGDPAHVAGVSVDVGTSTSNGLFPRTSDSGCLQYVNRTQSYCDTGDAYCDSGMYLAPHYEYINNYGVDAVEFVCDKAADAGLGTVTTVSSVAAFSTVSSSFTGFSHSTGFASATGSVFPTSASATATGTATSATSASTSTTKATSDSKSAASTNSAGSLSACIGFAVAVGIGALVTV